MHAEIKRHMPSPSSSCHAVSRLVLIGDSHCVRTISDTVQFSFAGTGFDPATGSVQTGLGKNDVGYDPVTGTANQASSSSNGTLGGSKDSIPGNFPSNMYALMTALHHAHISAINSFLL